MGRSMIILTSLLLVVFGIVQINTMKDREQTQKSNVEVFNETRANNKAMSGMELAIRKLKDDGNWRGPTTVTMGGQDVILEAVDYTMNSNLKYGHLFVKVHAPVNERYDSTRALVHRGGVMPSIYSSLGFYSDSLAFDASGKAFEISGHDRNLDGSAGKGGSMHGIKTTNQDAHDTVYDELKNASPDQTENVTGEGGVPSMTVDENMETEELSKLIGQYYDNADAFYSEGTYSSQTMGTDDKPEITFIDSGATVEMGGGSGSGILVIQENANYKLTGDFTYHGVIINQGEIGQTNGNVTIYGAFIFGSNSSSYQSLEINGNVNIYYSTEVLEMIESALASSMSHNYKVLNYYE